MNIIAIEGKYISKELADKFLLIPDAHDEDVKWWKIVIMDPVKGSLDSFLDLDAELKK